MDPQKVNPTQAGYSLANVAELLLPCLDLADARTVLEVGAFRGELTLELLDWAAVTGAKITAIDPLPPDDLLKLAEDRSELELLERTSHEVLAERPLPDAVVLDGDHNYFTLSEELRLIAEKAGERALPLLLFHDVGWPHARRDSYYAPERVPEDRRQKLAHETGLAPGNPGVVRDGLPFEWVAEREGGAANGVLTAIEDFMSLHAGLALVSVPAFFGFGILYGADLAYARDLEEFLRPFDQNAVLDRLEANRVAHLVQGYEWFRRHEEMRRRVEIQERLLWKIAGSRALDIAERVSRVRHRGEPAFTRRQVEQALAGEEG